MKPTKCPAREKKEAKKAKKKTKQNKTKKTRGGEEAKSKSQDCCVTFRPKNSLPLKEPELPRIRLHIKILHFLLYKRGSSLS